MPVGKRRTEYSAAIERIDCGFRILPREWLRATAEAPLVSTICSTSVFHSPQFSHLPVHFG